MLVETCPLVVGNVTNVTNVCPLNGEHVIYMREDPIEVIVSFMICMFLLYIYNVITAYVAYYYKKEHIGFDMTLTAGILIIYISILRIIMNFFGKMETTPANIGPQYFLQFKMGVIGLSWNYMYFMLEIDDIHGSIKLLYILFQNILMSYLNNMGILWFLGFLFFHMWIFVRMQIRKRDMKISDTLFDFQMKLLDMDLDIMESKHRLKSDSGSDLEPKLLEL